MEDNIIINKIPTKKIRILVAPLDWGLGHATRCISIIKKLLLCDYEVVIAAEGAQLQLLRSEFPRLNCLNLRGYRLRYGKTGFGTFLKICLQIPKILIEINREKQWLDKIIAQENIDIIISDNRFGLHSKKIVSVFLTHQLNIKTPFGKFIEKKIQLLNYRFINRFFVCWIVDFELENNLAGELSHPKCFPDIPWDYVGLLSRFEKKQSSKIYNLLILISGPEPQRTVFENIILKDLKSFSERTILIRGLPAENNLIPVASNVEIHNHLPSAQLNDIICASELIICRSGYSTIMDLVRLGKKCIAVPTPGQSEQKYLAEYLSEKKILLKMDQKDFSLPLAVEDAKKFQFKKFDEGANHLLDDAIKKLAEKIKTQPSVSSLG